MRRIVGGASSSLGQAGFTAIMRDGIADGMLAMIGSAQEPFRAGRWWWEQEDAKECGLHVATATRPEVTA